MSDTWHTQVLESLRCKYSINHCNYLSHVALRYKYGFDHCNYPCHIVLRTFLNVFCHLAFDSSNTVIDCTTIVMKIIVNAITLRSKVVWENVFPWQWSNRETNGTIRKCSSSAFQWMVISLGFDNLNFLGKFLCPALGERSAYTCTCRILYRIFNGQFFLCNLRTF
jgi:hypothetical protein